MDYVKAHGFRTLFLYEGDHWSFGLQWPSQFGYFSTWYDGPIQAWHLGPLWIQHKGPLRFVKPIQ